MAEEWDDIQQDDDLNEAPLDDSTEGSGKFDRLLGEDSRKYKLSGMKNINFCVAS